MLGIHSGSSSPQLVASMFKHAHTCTEDVRQLRRTLFAQSQCSQCLAWGLPTF